MSRRPEDAASRLPDWPRGMRADLAAAYVGLSASTIRAEQAAGRFPAPIRLTPGRMVYLREDLDAYLDRRAGRTPAPLDGSDWMEA